MLEGCPCDRDRRELRLENVPRSDGLHDQVKRALAQGAALLTGGTVPDRPGFFYPPTVLAGVTESMVPFEEELFGPVAALTVAEDVDDAVRLANATRFGLSSAVFTEDRAKGEAVARRMHAGGAFVNQMSRSLINKLSFTNADLSGQTAL